VVLTQDAAVVEAAPPRTGEVARAAEAERGEERVDEGVLTRDAVVVEAAPPRAGEVAQATAAESGKEEVDEGG